jgi:hypothetical protein
VVIREAENIPGGAPGPVVPRLFMPARLERVRELEFFKKLTKAPLNISQLAEGLVPP